MSSCLSFFSEIHQNDLLWRKCKYHMDLMLDMSCSVHKGGVHVSLAVWLLLRIVLQHLLYGDQVLHYDMLQSFMWMWMLLRRQTLWSLQCYAERRSIQLAELLNLVYTPCSRRKSNVCSDVTQIHRHGADITESARFSK